MDAIDHARLTAYAVNEPKHIDARTKELEARLRHDPDAPEPPTYTKEEMAAAAQRLMANVLKTGKLVS